jgi:uncharacterized protein (DUF4415 family)
MAKKPRIVRATAEEVHRMLAAGGDRSDWRGAKSMKQAGVESLADQDDGKLPSGWEKTILLGIPEPKQDVHIRRDPAVLRWFKAHGPGYQTRINAVLRAFVHARLQDERNPK